MAPSEGPMMAVSEITSALGVVEGCLGEMPATPTGLRAAVSEVQAAMDARATPIIMQQQEALQRYSDKLIALLTDLRTDLTATRTAIQQGDDEAASVAGTGGDIAPPAGM